MEICGIAFPLFRAKSVPGKIISVGRQEAASGTGEAAVGRWVPSPSEMTSRGGARTSGADGAGARLTGNTSGTDSVDSSGNTCRGNLETGEGTGASGVVEGSVTAGIPGSDATRTSEGSNVVARTLLRKGNCWDAPGGDVFMAGTGLPLSNGAIARTGPSGIQTSATRFNTSG